MTQKYLYEFFTGVGMKKDVPSIAKKKKRKIIKNNFKRIDTYFINENLHKVIYFQEKHKIKMFYVFIELLMKINKNKYSKEILKIRFYQWIKEYQGNEIFKSSGLNIRHQNPPEDITENIVKFIVQKCENKDFLWCKEINGLHGDLFDFNNSKSIEVKSFTSDGPCQFGPSKKFDVLYFLDLRNILKNHILLWKVNLNDESDAFKNVKVNKTQTMHEQMIQKRRPHISWNLLYPQIEKYANKIYEGNFESIFI